MAKKSRIPVRFISDDGNTAHTIVNIVLPYDDFETGKHAQEICGNLLRLLGGQCAFRSSSWKFDLLGHPKMQALATEEAAAANLVILAAPDRQGLPAEVKCWIQRWLLNRKNTRSALITLLCPPGDEPTRHADYSFLERAVQRAHVDFLYTEDLLPRRD